MLCLHTNHDIILQVHRNGEELGEDYELWKHGEMCAWSYPTFRYTHAE